MTLRAPLLLALCLALLLALRVPGAGNAIGKATPTPAALDVDAALAELPTLIEQADYAAAIALAGRLLAADAEAWEALFYRAFAHARADDLDAAIADYDALLALRPWHSGARRLRGDAQLQAQNPRAAAQDYAQALFFTPRSSQTYSSLARLHERDVDKSLRNYYQALVTASRQRAQGSSNRAIDTLSDAIDSFDRGRAPSALGYAYFARATLWSAEGDRQRALADLNAALALQPDMPDYFLARGHLYSEAGESVGAGQDFARRMTLLERESLEGHLAPGERIAVDMAYGLVARYRFEAEAGQGLTLAARDNVGAGVDPLLALLNPAGAPIAGDDDGGGELDALLIHKALPATGIYTVMLSHGNGGPDGVINLSLRLD